MTENSTTRMLGVQAGTGETNFHWLESGNLFDAITLFPHLPSSLFPRSYRMVSILIPKNLRLPLRAVPTHFKGGNRGLTQPPEGKGCAREAFLNLGPLTAAKITAAPRLGLAHCSSGMGWEPDPGGRVCDPRCTLVSPGVYPKPCPDLPAPERQER